MDIKFSAELALNKEFVLFLEPIILNIDDLYRVKSYLMDRFQVFTKGKELEFRIRRFNK
jgi:hypothetical protein